MNFHIVIPARYASERLPRKALLEVGGEPLVVRVMRQAEQAGASEVVVATDHEAIAEAVAGAGGEAQLTAETHQSGTDRVAEVARSRGWHDDAVVVNVQGDEPLIPPPAIRQCASLLTQDLQADMATLAWPIESQEEWESPNVVKVVCDREGRALYFSRAPIPHDRAHGGFDRALARRHIGLYAYRVRSLLTLASTPPAPLEVSERLEQLRALWAGLRIRVEVAVQLPPRGVDTAQDLDEVRCAFARGQEV